MEEIGKTLYSKISSYEILNNLLPGIVFCFLLKRITRFEIAEDNIIEELFIYYFIGIIISRIGSLIVETVIKRVKIKGKSFIEYAPYKDYSAVRKTDPSIEILSQTNNTYRTITSMILILLLAKIYDCFICDFLLKFNIGKNVQLVVLLILLTIVFVFSWKKQTAYIKKRVESQTKKKKQED